MRQEFETLLALEIGESAPAEVFESEASFLKMMKDVTIKRGPVLITDDLELPPPDGYPLTFEEVWFLREGGKVNGRWRRISLPCHDVTDIEEDA